MNPNAQQAIQNEEAGIEEEEEDIDYDALYGGLDVDTTDVPKSKELQNSYAKIFGDVAKQFTKETLIGLGGTWGDLAELAGAGGQTPGQQSRVNQESETLERINQPGYRPSFQDISSLTDEDIGPPQGGLPTSEQLRRGGEAIGAPGEPETPQGKYAARSGKLYGSGAALGQINPLPAIAAGTAGQAVEDLGGGPLAQAASEIATLLLTQGRSGKNLVGSAKKEVQEKINQLRQLGFTEEDITLAINSASKGKKAGINASKGAKTEKAFEDFAEHSDNIVNEILENGIQGYEKGSKYVHELASDAYGEVVKDATKLGIKKLDPFFDSMHSTMNEIKKAIGHNPAAKDFMIELTEHTLDIISHPTADNMIDFYKRLNSLGKWVGRNQKDRILSNVKESIKDTFKAEGKAGKELATKFEKANEGIQKAYKAEEIMGLIEKSSTQNGIEYNKLHKIFDKKDNVKLFEDVLGKKQADNIRMISKAGKEIKDFDKAWKATNAFKGNKVFDVAQGAGAAYYLYKGDMEGLASVLAIKGAGAASKKIAEKFLTDPKFQNLMVRGLHSIKSESPKLYRSANEAMKKYLDEEGIDIPLD